MAKHVLTTGALIISAVAIATVSTAEATERHSGATGIFRIFGIKDHPLPADAMFPRRHVHRLRRNEVAVPKWQDRTTPAAQFDARAVAPAPVYQPTAPAPLHPQVSIDARSGTPVYQEPVRLAPIAPAPPVGEQR